MSIDRLDEADTPQRRGAPFLAGSLEGRAMIRQTLTHVVKQQVGEWVDDLVGEFRESPGGAGSQCGEMTIGTSGVQKEAPSPLDLWITGIPLARNR